LNLISAGASLGFDRAVEQWDNAGMADREYDHYYPKHKKGGWGSELDLDEPTAKKLLNHHQLCKQYSSDVRVGICDGRIYIFRCDNRKWHAYPICGQQLCRYFSEISPWVEMTLGIDHKRLTRSNTLDRIKAKKIEAE
jgi:hypothetical protein